MANPVVIDVRPDGDESFALLPKLDAGDFNTLQAKLGFIVDRSLGENIAKAGEKYWALWGIEVKTGPAIFQPQVRNQDGILWTDVSLPGFLAYQSWPGAPIQNPLPDPLYDSRVVTGWTGNSGSCGWGYSAEAVVGPDGGVFKIWMSSDPASWPNRRVGSDCLSKIGWLGGTNHLTPNPIFRETVKGGVVPTPTGDTYKLVYVDANGNIVGYIPFTSGAPTTSLARLALWSPDNEEIGYMPFLTPQV